MSTRVVEFMGDAAPTAQDRRRWKVLEEVYGSGRLGERRDTLAAANLQLRRLGLDEFSSDSEMARAWDDYRLDLWQQRQHEQRQPLTPQPGDFQEVKPSADPGLERRLDLLARALNSTTDDRLLLDRYRQLLVDAGLQPVDGRRLVHDRHMLDRRAQQQRRQPKPPPAGVKVVPFVADVEAG